MTDFLVTGIIVFIIGMASAYIIKAKKKGVRCIGCPSGGKCNGGCSGTSSSHYTSQCTEDKK